MNDFAEFTGRLEFEPDGRISWRADPRFQREYKSLDLSWTPPYRVEARRLRGLGSQVHVAISDAKGSDASDLWLRGAKNFPV